MDDLRHLNWVVEAWAGADKAVREALGETHLSPEEVEFMRKCNKPDFGKDRAELAVDRAFEANHAAAPHSWAQ